MIKAAIFDLDGTLLNTIESMEAAGSRMLRDFDLTPRPAEEYKQYAGDGAKTLVRRLLAAAGKPEEAFLERAFPVYMGYFARTCGYHVAPYPGIRDLLAALRERNIRLAVLSNKPHQQTVDVVETYFGAELFDLIRGQSDAFPKKPAPDGALWMAKEFGVLPSECLYLGDTNVDMQTGKAAGMKTVGVLWGFRDEKELRDNLADEIIRYPLEALKLL